MEWATFSSHIRRLPAKDLQRIQEAYGLGEKVHGGQTRKSGEPFFSHPVAVAQILASWNADADTLIAALLHDSVEDTPLTIAEIGKTFGEPVANLIEGVTKLTAGEFAEKPTLNEQTETLRKMFRLMENDVRIVVIKLADRLHNMQTLSYLSPERQRAIAQETLDIYVRMAEQLSMQHVRSLLEELCYRYLDPALYQELLQLRRVSEKRGALVIKNLHKKITAANVTPPSGYSIVYEHKTWEKLLEQLRTEGTAVTGVPSLIIAVVCESVQECYQFLGILHQLWQREALSFQDYINSPLSNGYQGLHTTIILEDGMRIRCKIRTREMHEYTFGGITTLCFDDRPFGIKHYLPWTQRISTLVEDTKDRSAEFWQTVQSDLLGDSMLIHGPDDRTAHLPKDATALDGAFYLFGEEALKTDAIHIDGVESPLSIPLQHGNSISVSFADKRKATRDWLPLVRSGLATAMIRTSLSAKSAKDRVASGRRLFQHLLTQRKRGYIEEFDEKQFAGKLHAIGFDSMSDAFAAIAEGHLTVSELYESLFSTAGPTNSRLRRKHTFTFDIDAVDSQQLRRINDLAELYGDTLQEVRRRQIAPGRLQITLKGVLTESQREQMENDLRAAGVDVAGLRSFRTYARTAVAITSLLLLWGLDPVAAHFLLGQPGISFVDLTIARFWSFSLMSAGFLLLTHLRSPLHHTRLDLRTHSLWLSVGLLFCVATSTYISLSYTLPLHYTIPMTSAGIFLGSLWRKYNWQRSVLTWLLVLTGIAILVLFSDYWSWTGIVTTLLAVTTFSLLSQIDERYRQRERIDARRVQYYFFLSLFCTLLTLPLLPISSILDSTPLTLAGIFGFGIFFASLPYYITYFFLSSDDIRLLSQLSFLIIPITFGGQLLLHGTIDLTSATAAIVVFLGALVSLVTSQTARPKP